VSYNLKKDVWTVLIVNGADVKMSDKNKSKTESPCVNICELNENDICVGCGRSIDEIINWNQIVQNNNSEKVREKAKKRLKNLF